MQAYFVVGSSEQWIIHGMVWYTCIPNRKRILLLHYLHILLHTFRWHNFLFSPLTRNIRRLPANVVNVGGASARSELEEDCSITQLQFGYRVD